jgi:hypothetical protein
MVEYERFGGKRMENRGTVMVEYERFGGKRMENRGRMSEDIGWPPS